MASKNLKKLIMARNSSQIQEKIQIHFEINFVQMALHPKVVHDVDTTGILT